MRCSFYLEEERKHSFEVKIYNLLYLYYTCKRIFMYKHNFTQIHIHLDKCSLSLNQEIKKFFKKKRKKINIHSFWSQKFPKITKFCTSFFFFKFVLILWRKRQQTEKKKIVSRHNPIVQLAYTTSCSGMHNKLVKLDSISRQPSASRKRQTLSLSLAHTLLYHERKIEERNSKRHHTHQYRFRDKFSKVIRYYQSI